MQIVSESVANQFLSRDFTGNNAPTLRAEIEGLETVIDLSAIESLTPVVVRASDDNVIEYSQSKNGCKDNEGNLYIALKHINTANVFMVYQSSDSGATWNDLSLPVPSGTYGTGSASYKAPSIYHYDNKIYVIFLEKTSASENDTNLYFNIYDVGSSAWTYPTNSQLLTDSFLTWELGSFVGQPFCIVDSSGRWFVAVRASTTGSTTNARLHYNISTNDGSSWSGWTSLGTRSYNFCSCLDISGNVNITYQEYGYTTGTIVHAVYNGSSFDTTVIDSGYYYTGGETFICKSPTLDKLWLYKRTSGNAKEKVYYKEGSGTWTEYLDAPIANTIYNFIVDDLDTVHFFYKTSNKLLYKYYDGSYSSVYTVPQSVGGDSYSESVALHLGSDKIYIWFLSGTNTSTSMKLEFISSDIFSAANIPIMNFNLARDFGAIAQQCTLTLANTNPSDIADTGYYNYQRDNANNVKATNNFEGKIKNGIEIKIKAGYGNTSVYVFTGIINTVKIQLENNSVMDITAKGKSACLIQNTIKHVDTGITYRWMDYPILGTVETYYLDSTDTNPYLYEIWKDICMRAGFADSDVDFTTHGGNLCTLRYNDITVESVENVKGDWASFAQAIIDIMYYVSGTRVFGFFMYEDEQGKIYLAVDRDFDYAGNDDLTLTGTDWITFTDAAAANYRVVPESVRADGGTYTINVDFEIDYAKNAVRRIISGSISAGQTVNFVYTFCAWRFPPNQLFDVTQWVSHDEMYGTLVGINEEEEIEETEELTTLGDGTTVSTDKEITFSNEAIRTTANMQNYLKSKKLTMKRSYYNLQGNVICIPHLRPRDIVCMLVYGTVKELYKIVGLSISYNGDSGNLKMVLKCVLYELSGIVNDNQDYLFDSDGNYLIDSDFKYLLQG
jgi:hypothetical protein